ncbi:unnamed protein product [Musa hybrid cultivar]
MNAPPHAVLIPYPTAGHLNPMLELAKLLHSKGFFITFVNTEFSHQQLLKTVGSDVMSATNNLRFETIADGVSQSDSESPDHVFRVWFLIKKNSPAPLRDLILKLHSSSDLPPLTCIVTNFLMNFTRGVAEQLGVPELVFWTTSACGLMASLQLGELIRRGFVPLKDEGCLTNGYLDTTVDWIPGMREMRLRDLSSFIRTTNHDDILVKTEMEEVDYASKAWGVILNTFDDMEREVLGALRSFFPRIYTLGALGELVDQIGGGLMASTRLSVWREDRSCMEWLDSQSEASVVYVSFGSLTVLTAHQLAEFAWGLAGTDHPFLWIIRPDMVDGGVGTALPEEFIAATKGRSFFASWCHQGQVLAHRSVGGFLTHGGWNSMLESVLSGVPLICWPTFADQYTNCRYACVHWGFGLEVDQEVTRGQVSDRVRELMEGEKGKEMRERSKKWKEMAKQATRRGGSSHMNLDRLAEDLSIKETKSES